MRLLVVLLVFGVVCRESYSQNFRQIGGKYYHIQHYDKLNWFDARDKCKRMDAHLVSIQNYREWDSITDYLSSSKSYWVDIRDVESDLTFMSDTSGREAPFLKWSHGHPSCEADYDCVKLTQESHKMKTRYCSQQNHYICETNKRPVSYPVTTAPIVHHPSQGYDIIDLNVPRTKS